MAAKIIARVAEALMLDNAGQTVDTDTLIDQIQIRYTEFLRREPAVSSYFSVLMECERLGAALVGAGDRAFPPVAA
ncbi:hypothetical protein SEA_CLOWN_88 [Gordonia phage Clown]|uniref:Uncharacterized protein n=1 Tax=Gordonia phage Clown TaxID=2759393 RepID=A0A7L7SIG9_9CAUD|nr:hypothetical protein KNV25_gp88 [Gordonia phage Clown]QOC56086.1 hypothetical protein SEA_CLOWN_88 [Gordonia phage Clown]